MLTGKILRVAGTRIKVAKVQQKFELQINPTVPKKQ